MSRDLLDYQEQYKNQPYERFQVMFRKRKIQEILAKYKHQCLLEIGCGLEPLFLDPVDFDQLIIVEPADLFYENAIRKLENFSKKEHVKIFQKLLEDSTDDLKKYSFDFILLSSLMHEIPHQSSFFKQLHSICASETIIHINVPNAKSFHRILAVEMGLIKTEFQPSDSNIKFQQHTIFELDTLKKLVIENGFEIIEEGSYSFKPFTHQQMEDMIQAGFITEKMLDGFYKMENHLSGLGSEIFINVKKRLS